MTFLCGLDDDKTDCLTDSCRNVPETDGSERDKKGGKLSTAHLTCFYFKTDDASHTVKNWNPWK
jgi:hypothetical protein